MTHDNKGWYGERQRHREAALKGRRGRRARPVKDVRGHKKNLGIKMFYEPPIKKQYPLTFDIPQNRIKDVYEILNIEGTQENVNKILDSIKTAALISLESEDMAIDVYNAKYGGN